MNWGDRRARGAAIVLPPFNPSAFCPKCRCDEVRTFHAKAGCSDPECSTCEREHLVRTCARCGYDWPEAPLDGTDDPGSDR